VLNTFFQHLEHFRSWTSIVNWLLPLRLNQPFRGIEKAIMAAGLGLNPMNDWRFIRISSSITYWRNVEKELVKVAKDKAEQARELVLKFLGRDANDTIKKTVELNLFPEGL